MHLSRRITFISVCAVFTALFSAMCLAQEKDDVHTGNVAFISANRLDIRKELSSTSIGFVAEKEAARQLDEIRPGDEVRAVFGSATGKDGTQINKLISIRRCALEDEECIADRSEQKKKDAERQAKAAAMAASQQQCELAMMASLPNRFRDLLGTNTTRARPTPALDKLSTEARSCAHRFIEDYQDAFSDACKQQRCGDNVAGGCSHLVGYSITSEVIDASIRACHMQND